MQYQQIRQCLYHYIWTRLLAKKKKNIPVVKDVRKQVHIIIFLCFFFIVEGKCQSPRFVGKLCEILWYFNNHRVPPQALCMYKSETMCATTGLVWKLRYKLY